MYLSDTLSRVFNSKQLVIKNIVLKFVLNFTLKLFYTKYITKYIYVLYIQRDSFRLRAAFVGIELNSPLHPLVPFIEDISLG